MPNPAPIHEPDPEHAPLKDPNPAPHPQRGPNPDPDPEPNPDPEPDRNPSNPNIDPPRDPAAAAPPQLVLTSRPVPEDKPAKTAAKPKKQEEEPEQSPFSVTVGQVYDGPLDLLLDLIRKQDIDIYDIPISKITAQLLDYCHQLKQTDVDAAGEFIYMASLLIHIKSKTLLPRDPSDVERPQPANPQRELVERLLEHERFKAAAQMLRQKQQVEEATWSQ